ncbi:MAG: hypothetical protein EBU49_01700 [Proteobacteria bacterium]|nr:hypothetical protein [Pseudomonadota bacterium]
MLAFGQFIDTQHNRRKHHGDHNHENEAQKYLPDRGQDVHGKSIYPSHIPELMGNNSANQTTYE